MFFRLLYNTLTFVTSLVLFLPFLTRARGRARIFERFGAWGDLQEQYVWFHGASVGEVNGLLPIIRRWKGLYPEDRILLTSTSITGLKQAGDDVAVVRLLPFDCSLWFRFALRKLKIKLFIFGETEIWPELLHQVNSRCTPIHLVNGVINEQTFKMYAMLAPLFRKVLSGVRTVSASTQESADRFTAIGIPAECIQITGNAKYDREPSVSVVHEAERLHRLFFAEMKPVLVLGSIHPDELSPWIESLKQLFESTSHIQVVIAPRHQERFLYFDEQLQIAQIPFEKRSSQKPSESPVVLLDTLGELEQVYSFSSLAFVGGTLFSLGGHSPLEAASYGVPVIVGPHHHKIAELVDQLEESGGVFFASDSRSIGVLLTRFAREPDSFGSAGEAAKRVWLANRGATERIVGRLAGNG